MSRRDTIIVAVLVNAALLLVLFATAGRAKKSDLENITQPILARQESIKEDFLNQFVATAPVKEPAPVLLEVHQELRQEVPLATLSPVPIPLPKPVVVASKPPVAPNPAAEEGNVDITVKKGDVLEKIARANNTTVAALMRINNLSSTQLKVGQVLKVPVNGKKPDVPATTSLASAAPEADYYVVKEGDNPWLIASKNHVKLEQLLQMNGLDPDKARRLRPGDRLRIR